MTKDPRVYLVQILERVDRILGYTVKGSEAFFNETLIQDGVIRNLEVIGEAAKRIPNEFRELHPQVPWRSLAALRDVLIHQYEGVSLPEVWNVVEVELPILKAALVALVPPSDELERYLAGESGGSVGS